jgi:protein TonB
VRTAAPAPPAAPPAPSADEEARLEARIRDAVQQAVQYPPAARMMGLTGRAGVLLDYLSGHVDSPTLAQSSGTPMLDGAAIAAARAANYPRPPAEFEGRRLHFLVWAEFKAG